MTEEKAVEIYNTLMASNVTDKTARDSPQKHRERLTALQGGVGRMGVPRAGGMAVRGTGGLLTGV